MTFTKPWYANWFDTPFYHILYKHRNYDEAKAFIQRLMEYLSVNPGAEILDLACGKGRHTIEIASLGYRATGLDLSKQSIEFARNLKIPGTRFEVQDILQPISFGPFDAVLNLFTSFGYFEDDALHQKVFDNVAGCLKPNGYFLLDFLNEQQVRRQLVEKETKTIDNIEFDIKRRIQNGYVEKQIQFNFEGEHYDFMERVRLFSAEELIKMLEKSGLHNTETFGNYQLEAFSPEQSPRLIILSTKT